MIEDIDISRLYDLADKAEPEHSMQAICIRAAAVIIDQVEPADEACANAIQMLCLIRRSIDGKTTYVTVAISRIRSVMKRLSVSGKS